MRKKVKRNCAIYIYIGEWYNSSWTINSLSALCSLDYFVFLFLFLIIYRLIYFLYFIFKLHPVREIIY